MEHGYENLLIDFPEKDVARIALNRPEHLNAMTYGLVTDLHEAFDAIDRDHSVRVLILTGAGRGFCAVLISPVLVRFLAPKGLGNSNRVWPFNNT